MSDGLITVQQFNEEVRIWGELVRSMSASDVVSGTHSTGNLAVRLARFVDSRDENSPAYKVAFRFPRYGVFRAYGAGNGYKIIGGVPVKQLTKRKWRKKFKGRKALDWIDHNIEQQKDMLADSVQQFYGDEALRSLLRSFENSKIKN